MKQFYFKREYETTCRVSEKIAVRASSKEEAIDKINNAIEIPYLGVDDDVSLGDYCIESYTAAEDDDNIQAKLTEL